MPTLNEKKKIILFEYDRPVGRADVVPYAPGVYAWRMTNARAGFTDDHGVTGYYEYQQPARYLVRSVKHGELDLIETASYSAMLGIDNSFYYDQTTTFLYIHLILWDAPSENLIVGVATGFSMNADNPYYNDTFYEPRLTKVPAIKKSIDPLFFGVLKYQSTTVEFDNRDGFFDNWRSLNLYGQKGRVLVGYEDDAYSDFQQIADGFLSDDSTTFSSFSLKLQDVRKGLTQPIAINKYTKAEYPYLSDDDVDKVKPVVYGPLQGAPCVCLNATESSPSTYTFSYGDAEGPPYALYGNATAYNVSKNTSVTVVADYSTSSFALSPADATDDDGNMAEIRITLVTSIAAFNFTDSARFIRRLMEKYDGKPAVDTFYDADSIAFDSNRDTTLYIDDASTSLAEAIEKICYDSDLRFFAHDDGKYCIREYSASRAISATIKAYDWTDAPTIKNTGSEYLSSCIIKYKRNESDSTYLEYDSSGLGTYKADAYSRYKKYASKTFETGLYNPVNKANTIMAYSSNVQDIITRSTIWDFSTLEITDFVLCDPYVRASGTESPKVYEILGIEKDPEKSTVKLTLRYVRAS